MEIKNTTKNTIYAQDVDMHLPYKDGEVETLDPDILKKSKSLRSFIINGMLEIVSYDPNERIEASIAYLHNEGLKSKKEDLEEAVYEELDSAPEDIEVRIHGIFYDAGGYGKVNRNFALKLHEAGIKVKVDPKNSRNQLRASELSQIVDLTKTQISKNHICIDSVVPSFGEYSSGRYRVLYTTIESYTTPKQFLECCQMYDEIWITSDWSAGILRQRVDTPIYVVPAGSDPDLYTEDGPRFDLKPNIKDFVFISVFGWSYRKGYDVLLKAYFDEFDANDNVSLLIVSRYQSQSSRFHRNKIRDDINKIMDNFPNKDMPHVVRYSQVIPESEMPQLYRSADCFVLPARGEGSCCVSGTQIVVNSGKKDIETIVEGEYVLTHKGKFEKVSHTMSRYVNEEVYSIYTTMNGSRPITLTHEHPVLILKRDKILKNGKKVIDDFVIDNCEWVQCEDVKTFDYVAHPVNFAEAEAETVTKTPNHGLMWLTTTNYLNHDNIIVDNGNVYRNGKLFGKAKTIHPNCSSIPWRIGLTEDFLRFLGLYIAEGWCGFNTEKNKGQISFSFHSDKTEYQQVVNHTMKHIFGQDTKIHNCQTDGRLYRHNIICSNTLCSEMFNSLFGTGSHNKHLPDFSWQLSKKQRLALIKGIFEGDGCFYNNSSSPSPPSPSLSLSSVSEKLIDEVMLLLRSVGINACKQTKRNRGFLVSVKGEQINELSFIKNSNYDINKKKTTSSVKHENYVFLPVKKIEKSQYSGMVYNLEVENHNSYVTDFSVHNCLTAPEASLCGLPIIMTNVSGQQMYLREDNAFLIDMDRLTEMKPGQMHLHYWDNQQFPDLTSDKVHKQLKKTMRYIVNNYSEAKSRNIKLQNLIKQNFTWNHTANAAIKRLKKIKRELK